MVGTTYTTLLYPVMTEKSTQLSAEGKYTFVIDPRVTKTEVRNAVQKAYGVNVSKVNIIKVQPKKRWAKGRRQINKRDAVTKAIVTLKKGETLDVNKIK